MLVIRCKFCNKELISHPAKTQCCGCDNMTTIVSDKITAHDLSQVVIVSNFKNSNLNEGFSQQDLAFQESRRNRKVKRLEFEIR